MRPKAWVQGGPRCTHSRQGTWYKGILWGCSLQVGVGGRRPTCCDTTCPHYAHSTTTTSRDASLADAGAAAAGHGVGLYLWHLNPSSPFNAAPACFVLSVMLGLAAPAGRRWGPLRLPLVRPDALFAPGVYRWLLVSNFALRFTWTHRLLGNLEAHAAVSMVVAVLEALRRWGREPLLWAVGDQGWERALALLFSGGPGEGDQKRRCSLSVWHVLREPRSWSLLLAWRKGCHAMGRLQAVISPLFSCYCILYRLTDCTWLL